MARVGHGNRALHIPLQETVSLVQLQVTRSFGEAAGHRFVELFLTHLHHLLDIAHLQVEQTQEGDAHDYTQYPNR